jgi:membrane protein YdbS with pleckstrin-like domain
MLSEKDKKFMSIWEKERDRRNTVSDKILSGLPMALMFSLPIILLIFVVYIFFPEWYTRISSTSQGTFITVVVAVLISTLFFSYFRMHYKWEMNEQLYHELKKKEKLAQSSETPVIT